MDPVKKPVQADEELLDTREPAETLQPTVLGDFADEPDPGDITDVAEALELLADVRAIKANPDLAAPSSLMPEKIGRYRILGSAGRGGFSEVFHAIDEDLQRHVALKIPLVSGREDFQIRFEREARLAAMLSHRQIVPVYEFGNVGQFDFIAYGWVEGETLAEWLASKSGSVGGKTAAKIVAELARAMHYAHERGVIHRDLKPSNVLVDQSSTFSQLAVELRTRITDLGLSRDLAEEDQRLTQTGQALGTPAYMSPEQAGGNADVGVGADVHALGVMLYEMTTGTLPFGKANAIETIRSILEQSAPNVSKTKSGVSRELAAIIDKCLQKQASQRYLSAFDLAEDLDAFVDGRPVTAKPAGPLVRASRWIGRNRMFTTTVSLVVLSLATGLGTALWQWNNANYESIRANREADRAVKEAERASSHLNSMFQAIDLMLADNSVRGQAEVPESQKKLLLEIVKLQRSIVDDPSVDEFAVSQLNALSRVTRIHRYLGQYDICYELISESLPQFDELDFSSFDPKERAAVWRLTEAIFSDYVFISRRMNRPEKALAAIDEYEKVFEKAAPFLEPAKHAFLKVLLMELRGMVKYRTRELDESLRILRKASETVEDNLTLLDRPGELRLGYLFANFYSTLARTEKRLGMDEASYRTSQKSLKLLTRVLEKNPDRPGIQKSMGLLQMSIAMRMPTPTKEARELLEAGIKVYESLLETYPSDTYAKEVLAYGYTSTVSLMHKMQSSEPDSAISPLEGLEYLEKLNGLVEQGLLDTEDGKSKYLHSLRKKIQLLLELGRNDVALETALEAVDVASKFENSPGEVERSLVLYSCFDLLSSQMAIGNHLEAISSVEKIRKFVAAENERTAGNSVCRNERHGFHASTLVIGAQAHVELGQFEEAIELVRCHYLLVFESGPYKGHFRYRSSAKQMCSVLKAWQESETDLPDSFQQAKEQAMGWLEAGIENDIFPSAELLSRDVWDPLREEERFKLILEDMNSRSENNES